VVRFAVSVQGIVQGVGFRPFVYGAATQRGLSGWVKNRTDGVCLEVQGPADAVRDFLDALRHNSPPAARIERIDTAEVAAAIDDGFRIVESATGAHVSPTVAADQATCTECIAELESPAERRYRYPFTNCTRCGPRYTIIEALPYDRARTAMKRFSLCAACAAEYHHPSDRRFHAQPIACPTCGPAVRLLLADGRELATGEEAIRRAGEEILSGQVLALQGLGGFQLLVDATCANAVARLRRRKQREEKPFAVMFPSLEALRPLCALSAAEEALLTSPEAPIVLVRRLRQGSAGSAIATGVAPRNPRLGVMLPYTPLHRLLLGEVGRPLVCTSGNLCEEPMCIDEVEARSRLGTVADRFLVHDRPIVRPVDDSVVRIGPAGLQVLRRARGFAPLPLPLATGASCILALGGQLKSTVALAKQGHVTVSQHLGDLFSLEGALLLERTVSDLLSFLDATPDVIACDSHPDYASSRLAERLASTWGIPLERVQHHHAHVAACMAEHGLSDAVLGLAWDGAGLGADGVLWGGEALLVEGSTFRRVAHLRPFSLPGGEQAMREPRRAALGLLYEIFGREAAAYSGEAFSAPETALLLRMLERRLNSPRTTSMGRLFDAVASLAGVRGQAGFEGQAAMELEFAAADVDDPIAYPIPLDDGEPAVADWEPLVRAVLSDRKRGLSPAHVSARFHNALAALAGEIAQRVGLPRVVLSGGCFQNLRLSRAVRERLVSLGFAVYMPQLYPPNDGGLSLGQVLVAALRRKEQVHVSRHSG
jgi:hydrogenase maturation protein HypF